MLKFEEYLSDFTSSIQITDFLINLIVASLLAMILRFFYIKFGLSVSNRNKFASTFVPLALTTMLVITVVQSSIALSLGLVGALSIVRFRAAIKEPEELVYLFLSICIGLVSGANKPLLAIIGVVAILILLYFNYIMQSKGFKQTEKLFVNIHLNEIELSVLSKHLSNNFSSVELKRFDANKDSIYASFLVQSTNADGIDALTSTLQSIDPNCKISIIDQPNLII